MTHPSSCPLAAFNMTRPTFDNLTPPFYLWDGTTQNQKDCIFAAARWGAQQAAEQLAGLKEQALKLLERPEGGGAYQWVIKDAEADLIRRALEAQP